MWIPLPLLRWTIVGIRLPNGQATALWVLMTAGLALFGCATSDELDAMRSTMNTTMSVNKRSIEARLRQLEEARRNVEAKQARLTQQMQEIVAKVSDHQGQLDEQGRTGEGVISKVLDAEEAFHREGLRSVQAIRNELSSARSRSQQSRETVGLRREIDRSSFDAQLLR